ncbi:class I SAM-dependent methyltransferase [Streptomyces syringium]|uniref:SAM-dependent methyltransferase n=1 Tax=Streptomyces syringium TaxID=76729 RepID=A0ABS4XWM6_9ACTN|nr:class I SAM-dependent methyltransferase [Streptomyces syringium]MBP2400915.1 SAM-dependent methyltransferase [Streptomyces syringium]
MTRTDGFEDDEFWTEFYDFLFSEQRYSQAEELLDSSPLLAFTPGARVLDLCCGPGVFTVPLARRGHHVTGVDRSPAMLERAREFCGAAGAKARFVRTDALHHVEPEAYDVVLNMFTSFGYFEEHAANMRVLRNMRACLEPGGRLLLDVAGKELLARKVVPPKVVHRGGDLLVQTDTVLDDWARLRSDWVLVRGDRVRRASLVWFVYSAVELRAMAEEAGFEEVEIFGGFDGRPYDQDAERLILRASRQG